MRGRASQPARRPAADRQPRVDDGVTAPRLRRAGGRMHVRCAAPTPPGGRHEGCSHRKHGRHGPQGDRAGARAGARRDRARAPARGDRDEARAARGSSRRRARPRLARARARGRGRRGLDLRRRALEPLRQGHGLLGGRRQPCGCDEEARHRSPGGRDLGRGRGRRSLVRVVLRARAPAPPAQARVRRHEAPGVHRAKERPRVDARAPAAAHRRGADGHRVSPRFAPEGGVQLSRADLAHFLLEEAEHSQWVRGTPTLAY